MVKKAIYRRKKRAIRNKIMRTIFFTVLFFSSMFVTNRFLTSKAFYTFAGNSYDTEKNTPVKESITKINEVQTSGIDEKDKNQKPVENNASNPEQKPTENNASNSEVVKPPEEVVKNTDNNSVNAEEIYSYGRSEGKKYAYLTFDDGPNEVITPKVLDILKEKNIKATFFVVGKEVAKAPSMLKRVVDEGHSIGNHSYSHDYKILYPNNSVNVPNFKEEMDKTHKLMKDILGATFSTRIMRFPGGSFEAYKQPMRAELDKQGIHYIDWNAENGDGVKQNVTKEEQISRLKQNIKSAETANKNLVVLLHDSATKKTTLDNLPQIIELLKTDGYEFRSIK